jgi:simple sugar transport system ATP-binding protein
VTALPRPLVELRQVGKRFPGVLANDGIDLTLYPGEVHALLGENGAGKSTLLSMLAGLLQPDSGEIWVDGATVVLDSPAVARALGIGTVPQHSSLIPTLTVAENFLLGEGRGLRRPDRKAAAAHFSALCRQFGVAIDPNQPAGELSLGEQQLTDILRALHGSRVLVLDEPTAMLTPDGTQTLLAILRRATADGSAVLFITHKLDEALDVAARITVLRHGRVAGRFERDAERELVLEAMFGRATEALRAGPLPPTPSHKGSGRIVLSVGGLSIAAGEIVGIAGIDGNGQTPLAEMLAGQRAATGTIMLDGCDIAGLGVAARHRLGLRYVTDDRLSEGTVGAFPIAMNLLLKRIGDTPFWRRGIARTAEMGDHADKMIAANDIRAPGPWAPVATLSGGNVQKVLLARELEGAPRLVIYNKPTHGLDALTQSTIRRRIAVQAEAGVACLVISPDLDELLLLCDRIFVMRDGRLLGPLANESGTRHAVAALMAG